MEPFLLDQKKKLDSERARREKPISGLCASFGQVLNVGCKMQMVPRGTHTSTRVPNSHSYLQYTEVDL